MNMEIEGTPKRSSLRGTTSRSGAGGITSKHSLQKEAGNKIYIDLCILEVSVQIKDRDKNGLWKSKKKT